MLIMILCSVLPTLTCSKVLNHNSPFMETKTSNQDLVTTGANSIREGNVSRGNKEKVLEIIQKIESSIGKASEHDLMNAAKFEVSGNMNNGNKIVKVPNPQLRVSRSVGDSREGRLAINAEVNLVMSKDPSRTRKAYVGPRKTKKPKSNAQLRRLTANLKLAKVALQLGVVVYKDVLPVVGALAISSRKMLKEKVIPAVVKFGHSASHKAGRVAERTMNTLRAYAPLVKDTLQVTLHSVVGGVRQASHEVRDVAQEFRKNYSSALAKMRARQVKEEVKLKQGGRKASSPPPVISHRAFVIKGIVPR